MWLTLQSALPRNPLLICHLVMPMEITPIDLGDSQKSIARFSF